MPRSLGWNSTRRHSSCRAWLYYTVPNGRMHPAIYLVAVPSVAFAALYKLFAMGSVNTSSLGQAAFVLSCFPTITHMTADQVSVPLHFPVTLPPL